MDIADPQIAPNIIVPNSGGGLRWCVVVCGGLWWFAVVCGGLWWIAVVCLLVIPLTAARGQSGTRKLLRSDVNNCTR